MVLVTGGAGFIGSHFVRSLLAGRFPDLGTGPVTVLDNLGHAGDPANLSPVEGHPRLRFALGDVRDPDAVDAAVSGQDLVVHFAAESHVDRSIADSGPFVDTNVLGTQVLLDAALRHRVGRFVQVSTDEVYGSVESGSSSAADTLNPSSAYAASKASADLLALAQFRTHGLNVVVTRGANTYGPRQYPEKIIPRFITLLLTGGSAPLYGDGRNVREWLHVDDHCAGIALAAAKGTAGRVYHLGGGAEMTNLELTERILGLLGLGWERVRHVTDRKGHDLRYSLDTTDTHAELGYAPRHGIDTGLAETVRWYVENRSWWEPLTPAS